MRYFRAALIAAVSAAAALYSSSAHAARLEAGGAILMNLKSESVLYVQSEDVRIPPASLAKIMTLHLAMDAVAGGRASLSDDVKVSRRAASQPGARMNLTAGDVVTLDGLMEGTAVASGNDAAVAVAEHIGGSVEAFREMMNAKAEELGMSRTVFKNPNGLPSGGQVTTARDMLTLSKSYINTYPEVLERYHKTPQITYGGKTSTNKNPMLRMFPEIVDGLKTGWTSASKHNLITTAKSGDIRLVSVVMGAPAAEDVAYSSAFLIEAGFSTVFSGGAVKVASQLDAIERGVSLDIPATDPSRVVSGPDPASEDVSLDVREGAESVDYTPVVPREKDAWPGDEPEVDPGDDTEFDMDFDEMEFDDPSVVVPAQDGEPFWGEEENAVREIDARQVIEAVQALCIEANYIISEDIREALAAGAEAEENEVSRDILGQIIENAEIAAEGELPLCQDTGMAVVFAEIGQDVRITGGSIRDAINEGVRRGYSEGYLRASVVADPVDRVNTGDNTPAVIYFDMVPGNRLKITVAPKGFGSENMS
ncbi:MAG: fumarate hydratase, partial [Synergistaceae bacterium]|nr:fumarate hydratase [Synergistaceae bacterium]